MEGKYLLTLQYIGEKKNLNEFVAHVRDQVQGTGVMMMGEPIFSIVPIPEVFERAISLERNLEERKPKESRKHEPEFIFTAHLLFPQEDEETYIEDATITLVSDGVVKVGLIEKDITVKRESIEKLDPDTLDDEELDEYKGSKELGDTEFQAKAHAYLYFKITHDGVPPFAYLLSDIVIRMLKKGRLETESIRVCDNEFQNMFEDCYTLEKQSEYGGYGATKRRIKKYIPEF